MNRLNISKIIFDENKVLTAIKEYSQLVEIVKFEDTEYYILEFNNCKYDVELTMAEYENYLIDLTNDKG